MDKAKYSGNFPEMKVEPEINRKIGISISNTVSAILEDPTIRRTIRSALFTEGITIGILIAIIFSGIIITYNSIKSALSLGWIHDLMLGITLIFVGLIYLYKVKR